ncbi:c-type cytochrome [Cereibacter azotoformans]|uniref:Cytochrome c oxidase subunit 2 n=1 Tax=Cereibacter azotoformans TaxID=43057 RepID=A0A2T5KDL5_9RHOB|nr:c-type cytochrome [Cereibacter azotoformans]AXQ93710.1 cytochrome B [Cereibacter sphaeroides]MBO4168499.1 c-type cytochrome [Cereibacter azotoformans]PTR20513.1 cytochrome c oxidase subunit 2 [Cereibacter azotoformans]UIJ29214.1 c-type cytochrome [Cereibacter azotoformans]
MRRGQRAAVGLLILSGAGGCHGPQSVFSAGGADAIELNRLFAVMLVGAVILWISLNGLFFHVTRRRTGHMSRKLAEAVIIGGGILLPVVVLTALLAWGLSIMPDQRAPGEGLRVRITGEEWWWRVEYLPEGAAGPVISANELRLPAGRRTEIELQAGRVIHSFWVPGLGGKTDMIPGRTTRMSLEPVTPGTYRGQCAEFCGASHALMALNAVVLEEGDFARWLEAEAAPARPEEGEGRAIFFREGCGACHTIRGTPAAGAVGPDLTHFGSRTSLAAGILPMERAALVSWIANAGAIKPEAQMPAFAHLSKTELDRLAGWLEALE